MLNFYSNTPKLLTQKFKNLKNGKKVLNNTYFLYTHLLFTEKLFLSFLILLMLVSLHRSFRSFAAMLFYVLLSINEIKTVKNLLEHIRDLKISNIFLK